MNIYPAIDLMSGQCVRLYQGRYDQVTVYGTDPIQVAAYFAEQGATYLHVVDLDGAKCGRPMNLEVVFKLQQATNLSIQTGGGIRCKNQIKKLLRNGIQRVILGSVAIAEVSKVKKWIREFGRESIVLALDIRMNNLHEPQLALHGWQENSNNTLWQWLDLYQDVAVQHVLCTDIDRDGTLQGANLNLYQECVRRYPEIHFQASGGVRSLADLSALAAVPLTGVIVGKSLYENSFNLNEALVEVASC